MHGITPVTLELATAPGAARVFELRLKGHTSQSWEQEPAQEDVTVEITLVRTPVRRPRPRPRPTQDLDILGER